MRYFYLRSEDKVEDFFTGFTQCPHTLKMSMNPRPARECIDCLRELVDSARFTVSQFALESAIMDALYNHFSLSDFRFMDVLRGDLLEYIVPVVTPLSIPPDVPIGCIASELIGNEVRYAISACSQKDTWNKKIAREMAISRLRSIGMSPRYKALTGMVDVNVKPVKIEVLKRVTQNMTLPKHARRAAEIWLAKHPPRELVARNER